MLAGRSDPLAPPDAVRGVMDLVGSVDKTFREVPGGHMGLLAGRQARTEIWRPAARWLAERSDALGGRAGASQGVRFALEYEVSWDQLEQAIARRIDWDEVQPEDFRFEAEYIWADGSGGFRGVAIAELGQATAPNALIFHYGYALKVRASPAIDVLSSISQYREERGED